MLYQSLILLVSFTSCPSELLGCASPLLACLGKKLRVSGISALSVISTPSPSELPQGHGDNAELNCSSTGKRDAQGHFRGQVPRVPARSWCQLLSGLVRPDFLPEPELRYEQQCVSLIASLLKTLHLRGWTTNMVTESFPPDITPWRAESKDTLMTEETTFLN